MHDHVCPVWAGYLLLNPLRKLYENPKTILSPYIKKTMIVMDIGSAMGYYSLPMAEMVGIEGKVICVDMQEEMLKKLKTRALKSNIDDQIKSHLCSSDSLQIKEMTNKIDFVLASAVVHEVPDSEHFFKEIFEVLKPNKKLLVLEPEKRVLKENFNISMENAKKVGFKIIGNPKIRNKHTVLLQK